MYSFDEIKNVDSEVADAIQGEIPYRTDCI